MKIIIEGGSNEIKDLINEIKNKGWNIPYSPYWWQGKPLPVTWTKDTQAGEGLSWTTVSKANEQDNVMTTGHRPFWCKEDNRD